MTREELKEQIDELMRQYADEEIDGATYAQKMMELTSSAQNDNDYYSTCISNFSLMEELQSTRMTKNMHLPVVFRSLQFINQKAWSFLLCL